MAAEGRPINYGASVAWTYARIAEKEGIEPDGTLKWFQQAFSLGNWQNTLATPDELERILGKAASGLASTRAMRRATGAGSSAVPPTFFV